MKHLDALTDRDMERRITQHVLQHGRHGGLYAFADYGLSPSVFVNPISRQVLAVAVAAEAEGHTVDSLTIATQGKSRDLTLAALSKLEGPAVPRLDERALREAGARLATLAEARRVVSQLDATRTQVLAHPEAAPDAIAYLAEQQAEQQRPTRLVPLVDLEDVSADGALVDGLLLPDSLAILWGPSNGGKTALLHDLSITLAIGGDWCGRACQPVRVALLAYEGRYGLRRRLDAAARARGVRDLSGLDVYVYDRPPTLGDTAGLIALRRDLERHQIGVVGVDTLTAGCAGALDIDSGAGGDAARVVAALRTLQPPGGLVIATHHCGHDGSRMRGAYALLAAIDTELHAADGVLSTRKQRDLPSDFRVSYGLIPQDDTIVVGYGGTPLPARDDLRERVMTYLTMHPDASKRAVRDAVRGNRTQVFAIVDDLRASGWPSGPGGPEVIPGPVGPTPGSGPGGPGPYRGTGTHLRGPLSCGARPLGPLPRRETR